MTKFRLVLCTVVSVVLMVSCAPTRPRPAWMDKRINKPEILEGLGFAPVTTDIKVARDSAYNDALQKLVMAGEIQAKGIVETHLSTERDVVSGEEAGKSILDNVNAVIYDTVLQRKFFEEYSDRGAKEYWVYVYMPAAAISRITAEETLKVVKNQELKVSPQKRAVLDKIEQGLESDLQKYRQQEASGEQVLQQSLSK